MSYAKNIRDLKEIGESLSDLSKAIKNNKSVEYFVKADFSKLDRKLFLEIVYFCINTAAPDLAVNLDPSAAVNQVKPHGALIKDIFQAAVQLKKRYPWSSTILSSFQKSHFQDVRLENDKLVEFLKQLSNVVIYIVSNVEPGQKSTEQLQQEIQINETSASDIRASILQGQLDVEKEREQLRTLEAEYRAHAERFIQMGLFSAIPDRTALLRCIATYENKLLDIVATRLNKVASNCLK